MSEVQATVCVRPIRYRLWSLVERVRVPLGSYERHLRWARFTLARTEACWVDAPSRAPGGTTA